MSWGKRTLMGLAATVAGLVISPAAALAGVVVSVSGPSAGQYPVGKQIGDDERITLRDGDTLTVLDNGGTRVFRGAGTFMLSSQSGASRNRAFAALTTQRSQTRARTGAVRSSGAAEVSNPNLWYVDVEKSGTVCLPNGEDIRLWRGDTQAQSTYTIASAAGEAEASFPAGEMLAVWDASNPPTEGATYQIGAPTGSGTVEVEFVFIGETPDTPERLAGMLIENGCMAQLELMSIAMMD